MSAEPWADDYGQETAEEAAAKIEGADPFCGWCGDTGWRWVLGQDSAARYEHCDRCYEGDE